MARRLALIFLILLVTGSGHTSARAPRDPRPIPRAAAAPQSFDLLVYGATAGGVITAVAAAREGLTVALLEPGRHLGGMVSGGLGWTDYGRKEVIGGYSL
jgi:NADPH-dependent 2,4-dienoyl-CoA reductase/sulfur reductase-like enzyme